MRVQLTELGAMQSIAHLDSHDPLPLPSLILHRGRLNQFAPLAFFAPFPEDFLRVGFGVAFRLPCASPHALSRFGNKKQAARKTKKEPVVRTAPFLGPPSCRTLGGSPLARGEDMSEIVPPPLWCTRRAA